MTYLQQLKQSKLYPLYFLLRSPILFPRLVANEGVGGALRWLSLRIYLLFARLFDHANDFYEQPIAEFRSRLGFPLIRRVEMLVYDEIFLDKCYAFEGFTEIVQRQPMRALDFGTHHGLFIDYVRMLNPKAEIFGAEMNPESYKVASQRFGGRDGVRLNNVAIGGSNRRLKVGVSNVSVEQSLYQEQKEGGFEVEVITPMEFIKRCNLSAQDISLLKMDIEGAEREVFENVDSIKPILQAVEAFVIEIHADEDISLVQNTCTKCGLTLIEHRGINYFFRRK